MSDVWLPGTRHCAHFVLSYPLWLPAKRCVYLSLILDPVRSGASRHTSGQLNGRQGSWGTVWSETAFSIYIDILVLVGMLSPVLESVAEPGGEKFKELGARENAYFATKSKLRQKCVNWIILANSWKYLMEASSNLYFIAGPCTMKYTSHSHLSIQYSSTITLSFAGFLSWLSIALLQI